MRAYGIVGGLSHIRHIPPAGLHPGAPYHYGAVAPAGATLFTAGACPIDGSGRVPHPGATPRRPVWRSPTC